ncbi:hypothetical protein N9N28_09690 [Rubripirellula amarantea]|uniref:Mg-protoporphyrin IX methyl transferase n=1 Tax=Rubripirellula amarantea TaxID=2527999 RepID=A0A5C5WDM4_9BACT|nr:hypothetical protein [Rubripirellula amarantea]MDA8744890.1 hypothetical protein [Rubripirellula amarantea]TWT48191.1 Mg-protoporphyrin IX methyl transferase [Rubripirellula amarantea]
MTLQPIAVPDLIKDLPLSSDAETLVDFSNDQIEAFMLADQTIIENFVTCDFHLVAQALRWLQQEHLVAGNRFCEWGCGIGVVTMLAALQGMEAVGIEIEPRLVDLSTEIAQSKNVDAKFYCDSFVPRHSSKVSDLAAEVANVVTDEGEVYEEIGLAIEDFDLFFAFPWPGEHHFFEAVFDDHASEGSLLLTYRGREGMNLVRKI